jgi:hypothetical protein
MKRGLTISTSSLRFVLYLGTAKHAASSVLQTIDSEPLLLCFAHSNTLLRGRMKIAFLLLYSLLVGTALISAQTATRKTLSKATAATATQAPGVNSLRLEDVTYDRDIERIYWGDFNNIRLDRNGIAISLMSDTYMRNYGAVCDQSLPKNKVMIMNSKCDGWSHMVYVQSGLEVPGTLTCDSSHPVPSGIYADPAMLQAHDAQSTRAALAVFGNLGSVLTKTGDAGINAAFGMDVNFLDVVRQAKDLAPDMQKVIALNTCGGAPIRRFQQNLIAYLTNAAPMRMAGIPATTPFRDSDYQTFLDDLVAAQSRAWIMNSFQRDSIANVEVGTRDEAGHPLSITARYAFQSMGKAGEGRLDLRFKNGMPDCITYADVPDACRVIDPKVVTAFEDGKYVSDHPAVARTYTAPDLRKVTVQVDPGQQVLVEMTGRALAGRQGFVVPAQGKLVNDLIGTGPGGSIVLARAGSPVQLSVFNSQRSIRVNLSRVGIGTNQIADFRGTFKELLPGVDTLPRDNSSVTVSFTLPPGIRQTVGLTDFEKGKTATFSGAGGGATAPAVRPFGGLPGRAPANADARKVMLAGTLLHVELASPITVDAAGSGKLFAGTVVTTRSSAITAVRGSETLPEGTTVFVRVSQGNGRQFLIEGDHAVMGGVNLPLQTNQVVRVAMPARPAPGGRIGPYQLPGMHAGAVLLPGGTMINLQVRNNVALDAGPR